MQEGMLQQQKQRGEVPAADPKPMPTSQPTFHEASPPELTSASMQIDPPAVTCPVYQQQRGETTRRKNGSVP